MVDCENPVRLDAYHDGELSPAERSDVEAHLRDCPSCAAELAAMQGISGAFADVTPREPSHEQLSELAASVRAELLRRPVEQTDGPFLDPWPLDRWPDVPTRVVAGRGDRLFPLDLTTTLARERAGVEPDVIDTGHLPALADPDALVDLLDRYAHEAIRA